MNQKNVPVNPLSLARTINNVHSGFIPKYPTPLDLDLQYDSLTYNMLVMDIKNSKIIVIFNLYHHSYTSIHTNSYIIIRYKLVKQ